MLKKTTIFLLLVLPLVALGAKPERTTEIEIPPLTLEQHLQHIFSSQTLVATAVLKHESGLNLNAKGYNCFYYKEDGTRYSTFCKKEDRSKAWSVDCGIGQINVKGQICPKHLMTLEGAMEIVEKKYKEEGLEAWVSYTSGAYKKFL